MVIYGWHIPSNMRELPGEERITSKKWELRERWETYQDEECYWWEKRLTSEKWGLQRRSESYLRKDRVTIERRELSMRHDLKLKSDPKEKRKTTNEDKP